MSVEIAGCGGNGATATTEAKTTTNDSTKSTAPKTKRVYLATALGCPFVCTPRAEGVRFTPLVARGPGGYQVTIEPVEGCREQRIFNSYVYDVPMPARGRVTIRSGHQPPANLDARKTKARGAVTVFYARERAGDYRVTVTEYGKSEEVSTAK